MSRGRGEVSWEKGKPRRGGLNGESDEKQFDPYPSPACLISISIFYDFAWINELLLLRHRRV